jgi:type IV pilus assembly protein PilW
MTTHHKLPTQRPSLTRSRGFSLAELMIAIAIGLLIMAGMTTLFVNNSQAQAEVEKGNRQIENGRFAINMLTSDLRNAGYYAEFDPVVLAAPAVLPAPCAVAVADLKTAMPLHVQGVNDIALSGQSAAGLDCITDLLAGNDVLVVRHARTCVVGAANCGVLTDGGPFFQASLCNNVNELDSGQVPNYYALDLTEGTLTRTMRDCTTKASLRRYLTHIYYVAANDLEGDGIPTLKRAELVMVGGAMTFTTASLVQGVEKMHFQYGVDNLPAGTGDGVPDSFTADPGAVALWRDVVSVKINLLARNLEKTTGYSDSKSYNLGANAAGVDLIVTAPADQYKRHVFKAMSGLSNPIGRKTP